MQRTRKACMLAVCILFAFVICADTASFAKDPIKIGFMAPQVGVFAKGGKDATNGFRLGLEEAGYQAAGRPIVLFVEDDEAKPELGPTKARKLIENEKVDLIAGIQHSGVALAIRDIVVNSKTPLIITNAAGAVELTGGRLKSPYIFRTSFANGQHDVVAAWYAYNKLGFKRIATLAPDFTGGHERAEAFMKAFKSYGGQVAEELYPPLSTNDFGPYITKIASDKGVDGVWAFFTDTAAIRLINQYQEYGLKGRVPLFAEGGTVDDSILPSLKDAAVGIKNYLHYAETLNTPENQKFVKSYLAKYKEHPSVYSEQGYAGAKIILMAIASVKGDVGNKPAFLAALEKVKFNAPNGPFRFDANQNVIFPLYIREVRKVEGRYANVVVDTIPDVDQNWTPAKMKK